jgi:hypothetical protein
MLRAILMLTAALGCFSLVALAQPATQPPDKKTDTAKGKDDTSKSKGKEPGKSKAIEKTVESGKDAPNPKVSLDKLKLPKDTIVILGDNLLDAMSLFPKSVTMAWEKYVEQEERIKALERQLKPEKKTPSICLLKGKLEGDFIVFSAEYEFSTEETKTTVPLGLQGGYLLKVGDIDSQSAFLDYNKDDGFFVQVEKAPRHTVTLNFQVPVKKSSLRGTDRSLELGLPGAPTTIVTLDLPNQVKELRWNEILEKRKATGPWVINPDKNSKSLNLAWKEPLAQSGNKPLIVPVGQIKVDIDEKEVHITAELALEDKNLQTKDWRLLLPPSADIEVTKAPLGLTYLWAKPDEKTPYHILRTSDVTAESWKVTISMTVPRRNPGAGRVPIGPFHVLDAFQHQGTISVAMKPEVGFGQRVVFTRSGETKQKSAESESVFRYLAPPVSEKTLNTMQAKNAPLEMEWRFEKSQLETQVSHSLNLRTVNQGWEIDAVTRIQVQTLLSAINAIDLKLPQPHPRGVAVVGTASPGLAFPGNLPWAGMWKSIGTHRTYASPDEFEVTDESGAPLKLESLDATGKIRVLLERSPAPKKVTLLLKNKTHIPAAYQRIRMELPRPLGTQDRASNLSIRTDERTELLFGPEGAEEPVPDRDHFEMSWDQSPSHVDLAWKPYQRMVVAHSTIDITLHEQTAQVKQTLRFPRDPAAPGLDPKNPQIALKVPRGIDKVTLVSGGKSIHHDPAKQTMWLRPDAGADKVDLVLQYDLSMTDGLDVRSIWPTYVSQMDVKVRVWSAAGTKALLKEEQAKRGVWKERGIEKVVGTDQFPSLVLQGFGSDLGLSLTIEKAMTAMPAAFLADRSLIQIQMLDDGSQRCRARYLVKKTYAPHVDIELPIPLARFREPPTFTLGKDKVNFERLAGGEKIRVPLYPELVGTDASQILEINYTIPADTLEGNSFWRTTLQGPRFHSTIVIREMRWQLITAKPMIAASLGRDVQADVQWSWQNWLPMPESSVTSADREPWPVSKDSTGSASLVTYSFTHVGMRPETIYHLPREGWLMGCSGIFLILTLGGFFSPVPRAAFWWFLLSFPLAGLLLYLVCPSAVPPILFGVQPGVFLFVVFMGTHWLLQERYRRQLVFLPGFSRAKPGSTMTRNHSVKQPREASTIDTPGAAAPAEGSAAKTS